MSTLYQSLLVLHVLIAVLGVGSLASVTLAARSARRIVPTPSQLPQWLDPLLKYSGLSLGLMLATGVLLDLAAGGSFHRLWWFRGSVLLLLLTGALHGRARRDARQFYLGKADIHTLLRRVERLGYAMCGLVVVMTVIMEVRPF